MYRVGHHRDHQPRALANHRWARGKRPPTGPANTQPPTLAGRGEEIAKTSLAERGRWEGRLYVPRPDAVAKARPEVKGA